MTLLAVWKDTQGVHLAADSRLSFGHTSPVDIGAKIVPVSLSVSGPVPPMGTSPSWQIQRQLGMAVAGSLTTASVLQTSLSAVLSSLSSINPTVDMGDLVQIVKSVFAHISQNVCSSLFDKGLGEVILVGYCDVQAKPRAFLLEINSNQFPLAVVETELLVSTNHEYRGSGRNAALRLHQSNPDPINVLKDVVLDPSEPTVGGAVQYGRLQNMSFRMFLVKDYSVDQTNRTVSVGFFIQGIPVTQHANIQLPLGYVSSGRAIDPYHNRIVALSNHGYLIQ